MNKSTYSHLHNTARMVALGGNTWPLHPRNRLSFAYFPLFRWRLPGDSSSINTVVVGGKYGRGRGKIRSWSGENTVVVGGNFPLETGTVATTGPAVSCTCVLSRSPL